MYNNPLIYIDPDGYFLKEIAEWTGKRILGLVHGAGEFVVDVTTGIVDLAWNVGETIGSTIGYSGSYYAHELGLINDSTYNELSTEYMNNLTKSGQTLLNLPSNLVTGVINNFKTTFNGDNFINYLTIDNYNEIKDYSKSVVQTGVTLYGGYNVGKGIYNKIQTNKVMNSVNISNINYDKLGQIGNEYSMTKIGLSTMKLPLTYGNSEMFFNIKYPGDNPNVMPIEGFEWRGTGTPASGKGGYYNQNTKTTLSPDLNHEAPIGPHWDLKFKKQQGGYRIYSNNIFKIK